MERHFAGMTILGWQLFFSLTTWKTLFYCLMTWILEMPSFNQTCHLFIDDMSFYFLLVLVFCPLATMYLDVKFFVFILVGIYCGFVDLSLLPDVKILSYYPFKYCSSNFSFWNSDLMFSRSSHWIF